MESPQRGLGTRSRTVGGVTVFCPKEQHGQLLHVQHRTVPAPSPAETSRQCSHSVQPSPPETPCQCLCSAQPCRDTALCQRAGCEDLRSRPSVETVRGTERAGCPEWLVGRGSGTWGGTQRVWILGPEDAVPAPGFQAKGEVDFRLIREHTHWAQCSQNGLPWEKRSAHPILGGGRVSLNPEEAQNWDKFG